MCKSEDGVLGIDSSIVGILGVGQTSIALEISPHGSIRSRLKGKTMNLLGSVVPITPVRLIRGLAKGKLGLPVYFVIRYTIPGGTLIPLCDSGVISGNPF